MNTIAEGSYTYCDETLMQNHIPVHNLRQQIMDGTE
jgi:hypothetical protein